MVKVRFAKDGRCNVDLAAIAAHTHKYLLARQHRKHWPLQIKTTPPFQISKYEPETQHT
jgi:hypothetical protein